MVRRGGMVSSNTSDVFLRLKIQQCLKKFRKIKAPTRKKCTKSKNLFPTLFFEHQFWCHRITFHLHSKNSFFIKRVVHFLTSCQKVNIAFCTLFQDFSIKCRIDMFSLGCEVENGCTNPFTQQSYPYQVCMMLQIAFQ